MGGQCHVPAALPPGKRPGTHRVGGWFGPRAGLDRYENLVSTGIRSPDTNTYVHVSQYNDHSAVWEDRTEVCVIPHVGERLVLFRT